MAALDLRPWELVSSSSDWARLTKHLFRDDHHEHGAVLACGISTSKRSRRLLVRHLFLAKDGRDYLRTKSCYQLQPAFISRCLSRCNAEGLGYLAVHNHGGTGRVAFSQTDLSSHESGYPALLDITSGTPVGALVLANGAAAGDIWEPGSRSSISRVVVHGPKRVEIYPAQSRDLHPGSAFDVSRFDGQLQLFGSRGQEILARLRVGVVGAGGAGSIICQALTHLGVGNVVAIDPEHLESSNRPRVVYSMPQDEPRGDELGTLKVLIAQRGARATRPDCLFEALAMSVDEPEAAAALSDCDAIFLAADSAVARHVVNAVSHQFVIPTFQVGAKATGDGDNVEHAFAVSRTLGPDAMCMWCAGLVDPYKLQLESLPKAERAAAEYVQGVREPSVFTMNAMSTAFALNDFLFMVTGLHRATDMGPREYEFLERRPLRTAPTKSRRSCKQCVERKARGDNHRLPTIERA